MSNTISCVWLPYTILCNSILTNYKVGKHSLYQNEKSSHIRGICNSQFSLD